jgi:hypothetical protein
MGRFETEILSTKANLVALMKLSGRSIDPIRDRKPVKGLILDMDNPPSEAYGDRRGTAYNQYFEGTCYHPLFLFNAEVAK